MRDRDIRSALHARLQAEHSDDPKTLIVNELGLCQGAVRADVAVVNGSLAGFEIKSDCDTLLRLPHQAEAYGRVFDYVTLVVGPRHASAIEQQIPAFWGIAVATQVGDAVELDTQRVAGPNVAVDSLSVARLLWRDEALALLEAHGLDRGLRSKPRQELWRALVAALPEEVLSGAVRETLRARAGWRSAEQRSRCGDSSRSSATS